MKPWKLESMYQRAGLTYYKSTSHKLRILYLKSFFFLNKFQLFREFLKSPLREQMSWRQSKNWVRRYTLDKRGWPFSLLSKHWFWLWHGAREISFNVVSYLCCKKKQITPVLSVKSIWWATENTLKTKKYILALKKVEIRVYEKTTTSVINNVSAYSTDSITPDFRLRKGYRFLIPCHSRLQTFSKQRCMLLCDSSPTVIFISVFIRLIAYQRRFSN